ncbi:MAG: M12 family metallopeptidase [Bryobacteraceae bacterium]
MSTTSNAPGGAAVGTARAKREKPYSYCNLPVVPPRELSRDVNPFRAQLIRLNEQKWTNGTVLHYHFMDTPAEWKGAEDQKQAVRKAFEAWKSVDIGVPFQEVQNRNDAEIRIGFLDGDGAWSYVGRDVLDQGRDDRTMNFGWDIRGDIDTAIHEIGHTLGFPHEHQNPRAGIVWDEEAVYAALAGPPNFWPRDQTFHNIIRKILPDLVQGSNWDADSVMHYPFEAGLIRQPEQYRNGLQPAGGLSARDREWVRTFYPALSEADYQVLEPFKSLPLNIAAGQQVNLRLTPKVSRRYNIGTFGASDTVMVLFLEDSDGNVRYLAGDDDSGADRNSLIQRRLLAGRNYIVRIRLYYAESYDETAVMAW